MVRQRSYLRRYVRKGQSMIHQVTKLVCIISFLISFNAYSQETEYTDYKGVVTLYVIPGKFMRVNKIIENPKPGTSYIGEENLLVEFDNSFEVMSNWTVVTFKYSEYSTPKIIKYTIFDEEKEIIVKYHAVDIKAAGDLSAYTTQ